MRRRNDTVSFPLTIAIVLALVFTIALVAVVVFRTHSATQSHTPVELEVNTWEQTVKANPNDSGSRIRLGYAYYRRAQELPEGSAERTKFFKKALAAYDASLKLKKTVTAKYNRALTLEAMGEIDKALEAYEQLVKEEKGRTLAAQRAGEIRLERGDVDKAISLLEGIAEAEPGAVDIRYDLARAYVAAGKTKKAKEQLEQALRRVPDYEEAESLLESITASQGK